MQSIRKIIREILEEGLKSKSHKGNRYFEMLKTAKFQHYDSPKGELSTFYKGEEDRKRLVSKLSDADKKQYREWLKTSEGQESIKKFQEYASSGYKEGDNNKLIKEDKIEKNIIYTIGNEENYDELLAERPLYKSIGGSAWKNYSAAEIFLKSIGGKVLVDGWEVLPAAIYEMSGDWEIDVDKESMDYGTINKKLKIEKKVSN